MSIGFVSWQAQQVKLQPACGFSSMSRDAELVFCGEDGKYGEVQRGGLWGNGYFAKSPP